MAGRIVGWMDGRMDGWIDGRIDGWMHAWMADAWMDGWMDGLVGGWIFDRWMDGWVDGCTLACRTNAATTPPKHTNGTAKNIQRNETTPVCNETQPNNNSLVHQHRQTEV